jgi:hypothetical protein
LRAHVGSQYLVGPLRSFQDFDVAVPVEFFAFVVRAIPGKVIALLRLNR